MIFLVHLVTTEEEGVHVIGSDLPLLHTLMQILYHTFGDIFFNTLSSSAL